jgi:kumamolisin
MNQSHVVLEGSERVPLPGAQAIGAAHSNEPVEVTIKIRRKAQLPSQGNRPKPMSEAELSSKYGADQGDIDRVCRTFDRYGLKVVETNPGTRSVKLAGTVDEMEKAFQVKLIQYKHERGNYRGRRGPILIPKELEGIVVGVFGLDNRRIVKERRGFGRLGSLKAMAKAKHRSWFYPGELADIYKFPPGDGSGQSIGLLEFGGRLFL